MMHDGMLHLAKRLISKSAWTVDSTFKTNQYSMLVLEFVFANKEDIEVNVFLMSCSNKKIVDLRELHYN